VLNGRVSKSAYVTASMNNARTSRNHIMDTLRV
jgi:hypothetical protein